MNPFAQPGISEIPTPAGWYPLNGELRYWDGGQWTTHRQPLPGAPLMNGFTYPQALPHTVLITDARSNTVELVLAWILTVITLGYMLPWAIAATRGKSNSWAIGLLNFLLGWTFIGWIAALVMACTAHQVVATRDVRPPAW